MSRLFSNLEIRAEGLQHQPGNVWGCTALISGTTVGAGILALPAVTAAAGVIPSSVLLLGVWLYALVAALLIVEVNLQTLCMVGRPDLGLLAMINCTLGRSMAWIAAAAYLFLHYALLVAYVAQGGDILAQVLLQIGLTANPPPTWVGILVFALSLGGLVFWGRPRWIETINSFFVGIVVLSFLGLLLMGGQKADLAQLNVQHWRYLSPAVSVMLVALFYHNVIPMVTTRLEGDIHKIRQSIVVGSAIPLLMFFAWNAVILCCVDSQKLQSEVGFDPLMSLQASGAGMGALIAIFSEVAIATSFIGFTYGLLDLFQDVCSPDAPRLPLYALILLPTLSLAILNPTIFFTALDYVGTFSITFLGGIFPTLMSWKLRHQSTEIPALLPGGKLILILMLLLSSTVIATHILGTTS